MDLEAVAAELGVHYQTVYRWVRAGNLPAVMVPSGYDVKPSDVAAFARTRTAEASAGDREDGLRRRSQALARSLAMSDEQSARSLVLALHQSGVPPITLCEDVIVPALSLVEDLREAGSASAAECLAARRMCEQLVGVLAFPSQGRPRGLAVVAGPEPAAQRLPTLLATVALRSDHWRVLDLGPNVPASDIVEFTIDRQPEIVVIVAPEGHRRTADLHATIEGTVVVPVLWVEGNSPLSELVRRVRRMTVAARESC